MHQPAQRPLDHPPAGADFEPFLSGFLGHDLGGDPDLRGMLDEPGLISGINPDSDESAVGGGQRIDDPRATVGVLHRGGGHHHGQQQPESVGGQVPLAPFDPFGGVDALLGLGDGVCGLDSLTVDDPRGGFGGPARLAADPVAQQVVDLFGDPVGFPGGVVAVDGLVGREVVGQVCPGDPGPGHVLDRVDDLSEVVGRLLDAQAAMAGPPGGQDRFDQCPAVVGEVGTVGGSRLHTAGLPATPDP